MATPPKRPDNGEVGFDDWDSALDEWDAQFESMVEPEAPRAPVAAAAREPQLEPLEADAEASESLLPSEGTMVGWPPMAALAPVKHILIEPPPERTTFDFRESSLVEPDPADSPEPIELEFDPGEPPIPVDDEITARLDLPLSEPRSTPTDPPSAVIARESDPPALPPSPATEPATPEIHLDLDPIAPPPIAAEASLEVAPIEHHEPAQDLVTPTPAADLAPAADAHAAEPLAADALTSEAVASEPQLADELLAAESLASDPLVADASHSDQALAFDALVAEPPHALPSEPPLDVEAIDAELLTPPPPLAEQSDGEVPEIDRDPVTASTPEISPSEDVPHAGASPLAELIEELSVAPDSALHEHELPIDELFDDAVDLAAAVAQAAHAGDHPISLPDLPEPLIDLELDWAGDPAPTSDAALAKPPAIEPLEELASLEEGDLSVAADEVTPPPFFDPDATPLPAAIAYVAPGVEPPAAVSAIEEVEVEFAPLPSSGESTELIDVDLAALVANRVDSAPDHDAQLDEHRVPALDADAAIVSEPVAALEPPPTLETAPPIEAPAAIETALAIESAPAHESAEPLVEPLPTEGVVEDVLLDLDFAGVADGAFDIERAFDDVPAQLDAAPPVAPEEPPALLLAEDLLRPSQSEPSSEPGDREPAVELPAVGSDASTDAAHPPSIAVHDEHDEAPLVPQPVEATPIEAEPKESSVEQQSLPLAAAELEVAPADAVVSAPDPTSHGAAASWPDPFSESDGIELAFDDPTVAQASAPIDRPLAEPAAPASLLPARPPLPLLSVPIEAPVSPASSEDADAAAEVARLFEREGKASSEAPRKLDLTRAAARAAERAGEMDVARRLHQAVLAEEANDGAAIRALRRLALGRGDRDEALTLLEKEAAGAGEAERVGLTAIRAELLLAVGERAAAHEAFAALAQGPLAGWARSGAVDAASADEQRSAGLAELGAHLADDRLAGAIDAERSWLAGGAVDVAGRHEEHAVSVAAAFVAMRSAVAAGARDDEAAALERLSRSVGGELLRAVRRRLAALRLMSARPDRDHEVIALLTGAADAASLELRLRAEEAAGEGAAVESTLAQLVEASSGEARCDHLLSLAERLEARGELNLALARCEEALLAAPGDPRAEVVANRLRAALGGGAHEQPERRDRRQQARKLVEGGEVDQAITLLSGVAPDRPEHVALVEDLADLLVTRARYREAAEALEAAASARRGAGERLASDLLLERAARLHVRGGEPERAAAVLRSIAGGLLGYSARQRLVRLIALLPDVAAPGELAGLLAAEAAQKGDGARAAASWYRHGLASAGDAATASASFRRAIERDPDHVPALLALEMEGDRRGAAELRRARLDREPPPSRLQALSLAWRAALTLDGLNEASAAPLFERALGLAGPASPLVEDRQLSRARRLGDRAAEAALLERQRDEGSAGDRVRALVRLAERHLREGDLAGGIDRYRAALDLHTESGLVRPGLERTLLSAGGYAELDELWKADLAVVTDPRRRVALLERIAFLELENLGDLSAAHTVLETLLEADHANHAAFRVLEQRYLLEDRSADRIALYAQMGLTATDPRLATAVILERARLRQQVGGETDDLESDLRQAVFKDPRCRPALRQLLALAERSRRAQSVIEICDRLAADPELSPRSAALFLWRAGDALLSLGRGADAQGRYRASLRFAPDHAPGLRALIQISLSRGAFAEATEASEAAARGLRDPAERLRAALVAGALAEQQLADDERALSAWRAALAIEPLHPEALARVVAILDKRGDDAQRAAVLAQRAAVEPDPARAARQHVDLALIYRDRLHDPDRTHHHLSLALSLDAAQPAALAALADLHLRLGAWQEAADALIRCARVEKDPAILKDVYLHLGVIYSEHLPDAQRAIVSFSRVLQVEPDHALALARIASLNEQQGDYVAALKAVGRMAQLEKEPVAQIALLIRGAGLQAHIPNGERNALELLRRALALDPLRVSTIIAMADFYERRGDATSARVQLDTSSQLLRQQAERQPLDPAAYHSLFQIFLHRRSIDAAVLCASVLDGLGAANGDEAGLLARFDGRDQPARAALADHAIDEQLLDVGIPNGFRTLISRLDEPLGKLLRGDIKRFGVGRGERVPKVHIVREMAAQVAGELGLREVEIYVTHAFPTLLTIELTDPLSIIAGDRVLAGAGERELRFLFARELKLAQAGLAVALRASPDELGAIVGGLVRQYVPDFVPAGFDPQVIAQEAARLSRVIPRKIHQDLMPFALECSAPHIDWRQVSALVQQSANRAGLLAAGSVSSAVAAVRRLGDESQLRALLRFAVSDELFELRRLTGVAVA